MRLHPIWAAVSLATNLWAGLAYLLACWIHFHPPIVRPSRSAVAMTFPFDLVGQLLLVVAVAILVLGMLVGEPERRSRWRPSPDQFAD